MQSIIDAIKLKISGSTLESDVNGRVYLDEADDMTLPYCVWFVVTFVRWKTFTETFIDALVQFSLFSAKTAGMAEIGNIEKDCKALFDECSMTISGATLVWCRAQSVTPIFESDTTLEGSVGIRHWPEELDIRILLD